MPDWKKIILSTSPLLETIVHFHPSVPGIVHSHYSGLSERRALPFNLHLKDDSSNPTFSFKDRASALVSAYAKEHGIRTIVAASTGNAGSSLAGICASQGQDAVIIVPEKAPMAKLDADNNVRGKARSC